MTRTVYFVDELFYPVQTGAQRVYANQLDYFVRQAQPVRLVVALTQRDDGRLAQFLEHYQGVDLRVIKVWEEAPGLYADYCSFRSPYQFDNLVRSYGILARLASVRQELARAEVFLADYVFKTPLLDCLNSDCLTVCQTIDIQAAQFPQLEGKDALDPRLWAKEKKLLRRWDVLLSISRSETQYLRDELPDKRVAYLPQFIPGDFISDGPAEFDLGYISSAHPPNVNNLYRFYFDVFLPYLKPAGLRLAIAGSVCQAFTVRDPAVVQLGWVADVADLYRRVRLVVCPTWHGAGLNIKAVEALAHGRPIVITPRGRASLNVQDEALPTAEAPADMAAEIRRLLDQADAWAAAAAVSRELAEKRHSPAAYDRAAQRILRRPGADARRHLRPRSLSQRFLGWLLQTRKTVTPGFFWLQLRRGLIFYLANHWLPQVPFYRLRYWYLRTFCQYQIGRYTSIAPTTFFTGNRLEVGDHCVINRQCYLDAREGLYIGSNVSISNQVYIQTATHNPQDQDFTYVPGPVTIGDYVWIGARAIINPGVTLGEGAVVGAGAVVTRDVAPYTIVAGVPARPIGTRARQLRYQLDYFPFFDTDYAPYFGSAPGVVADDQETLVQALGGPGLLWGNTDPEFARPFGRGRLTFGGEQQRSYTRLARPAESDSLRFAFARAPWTRPGRLAVYLDWRDAADERVLFEAEFVDGQAIDFRKPAPPGAQEVIVAFKSADDDVHRAITQIMFEWLRQEEAQA